MKYQGKEVSEGIAIGKIYWYQSENIHVKKRAVIDIAGEIERLENALLKAKEQIQCLYTKTLKENGKEQAIIFEIHGMMLEDADYTDAVKKLITKGINAEYAIFSVCGQFMKMFASMDDKYMQERAADIRDISYRLIGILSGTGENIMDIKEPVILLVDDITPSEIIGMDTERILAVIARQGSVYSHASILAKGKNLPMIVNVQIPNPSEIDGKTAIADCFMGELLIEPQKAVVLEMTRRKEQWIQKNKELLLLKGKENKTKDGRTIEILAIIGSEQEAIDALKADAGGIGLFRSEYLYMDKKNAPSEEEQYESYKNVLQLMQGKKVIIRTVDIGADKPLSYLQQEKEINPALGCRGIRFCLEEPEMLMAQLRAIYKAAEFGNAAIMFPMVISKQEIVILKQMAKKARKQLEKEGYPVKEIPIGIMIETPAAALIAEELAEEADFFSIGTNDLIQYTLALDRQNSRMENYYEDVHPGVLKLIEMTVQGAHRRGIKVGICGELAGDITLTEQFLAMKVDELSVTPATVLKVRKAVREI